MTVPNLARLISETTTDRTIRLDNAAKSTEDKVGDFIAVSAVSFLYSLFVMLALGIGHAHIWQGIPLLSYWETYIVTSAVAALARPFTLRRHVFGEAS